MNDEFHFLIFFFVKVYQICPLDTHAAERVQDVNVEVRTGLFRIQQVASFCRCWRRYEAWVTLPLYLSTRGNYVTRNCHMPDLLTFAIRRNKNLNTY